MAGKNASSGAGLLQWLLIAGLIILADQFTKILVIGAFQLGEVRPVTSFFDLVRAHNYGAAFSFLHGASGWQRWFFLCLGLAATLPTASIAPRPFLPQCASTSFGRTAGSEAARRTPPSAQACAGSP